MKKYRLLFLLAAAVVVGLAMTSCEPEEVDAFIQEGNVTSIQEARNLIEHANCMATDTSVYIYLRRQLNELIERIKLTHFSGAYKKMQRQQDFDKEMLDRGPSAKIMYIPSGGQNKRY